MENKKQDRFDKGVAIGIVVFFILMALAPYFGQYLINTGIDLQTIIEKLLNIFIPFSYFFGVFVILVGMVGFIYFKFLAKNPDEENTEEYKSKSFFLIIMGFMISGGFPLIIKCLEMDMITPLVERLTDLFTPLSCLLCILIGLAIIYLGIALLKQRFTDKEDTDPWFSVITCSFFCFVISAVFLACSYMLFIN